MRTQIDALAGAFELTPLPGSTPGVLAPFRLAIYGLLVWLAGQALVSVLLGLALFDRQHRRIRAHHANRRALPDPERAIQAARDHHSDAA